MSTREERTHRAHDDEHIDSIIERVCMMKYIYIYITLYYIYIYMCVCVCKEDVCDSVLESARAAHF